MTGICKVEEQRIEPNNLTNLSWRYILLGDHCPDSIANMPYLSNTLCIEVREISLFLGLSSIMHAIDIDSSYCNNIVI